MTNYNITPYWEVSLYNQAGKPVALFENMESFSLKLKLNDVGTYSILFVDNGDDRLSSTDYWQLDGLADFVRDLPYYSSDIGEVYTRSSEFRGLMRKRVHTIEEDGLRKVTFEGVSLEHLLGRRVIAANEGTVRADKDDFADVAMFEYVQENCGGDATPEAGRYFYADYGDATSRIDAYGVMPRFVAVVPAGLAPNWAGTKSFENLLDTLKEISKAKRVDFRVVYDVYTTNFTFQTFANNGIGKDRTFTEVNPSTRLNKYGNKPVVFSLENNNVQSIELNYDRGSEANFVFVLGQGDMSTRSVYPAENVEDTDDSPWNQIEITRSASDNEYVYQLKDSANVALSEGAYLERIDFTPFQTPSCFYGYHYFLGDFVSVKFDYALANYRIVGVTITYDSSGEKITLEMESPTRQIEGTTPNAS